MGGGIILVLRPSSVCNSAWVSLFMLLGKQLRLRNMFVQI